MAFHSHDTCSSMILILLLLTLQATMPYAANQSEDALLKLKQSLSNATALSSWDPLTTPCTAAQPNWLGLVCSRGGNVFGIKLENMSLSGKIDIDVLSGLPQLRYLSLMNNKLEGPMPNMKNLRGLKMIALSNNLFEGALDPQAFVGFNRLRKLQLANNRFSGQIPSSLTKLPRLIELRLEGNQFEGTIPDFASTSFQDLNMANNKLEGPIPLSLSRMSPNTFVGNRGLCGLPLEPCKVPINLEERDTPTTPPSHDNSISILSIIIAIAVVLLVIVLMVAMIFRKRSIRNKPRIQAQMMELPSKKVVTLKKDKEIREGSNKVATTRGKNDTGRLCFVKEDGDRFDLPDLLRASAEILGSGCFGSSYKASLLNGTMMVVKRFKHMNNVGKEEFQEHMRRIGRLEHKNVVSLVAYYYRREEKLLVSNFVKKGSLAAHLHGNQSKGSQPTLDWPTRLNIIKGVSRGLSYIYKQLTLLTTPHGHLKSSNILLDESMNPLIHDYGLIPLINQESAQQLMVAYKTPEYVTTGRINKKTDVWCLGIVIIEVMTGQFPSTYLQQGSKEDLSSWVKEVAGDAKGRHVFDKHMGPTSNSEGEMRKLLDIGLRCCENDVEKRWDITEACTRIEEVKERDNDDDFYSVASYKSDVDRRSSRATSDDFSV